jgi:chromosome segregation ATPase
MKDQVQQVVVRVVASELDRRARPMEQAIRDLQQRASNIEAGGVSLTTDALVPIQHSVAAVTANNDRVSAKLELLSARVLAREAADEQLDDAVRSLRSDVGALQQQLSQLISSVERLSASIK